MKRSILLGNMILAIATSVASGQNQNAKGPSEDEPTLPQVVVQPESPASKGDGTISWSSNAISTFNTPVGPYNQPSWTTQRAFSTTRAYVLPTGTAEVEQWVRPTWNRDGKTDYRFLEEFAIGLPYRLQLDLYERWNVEPDANNRQQANHEGVQIELRYALADWGEIPFNPTLYAEWNESGGPQDKPDQYELKLLLSQSLTPKLFYASNFVLEQEVSGARETELQWSQAISTPLIEQKLLVGLECYLSRITEEGNRRNPTDQFVIGPSLQWKPTKRTFFDIVALFGATPDSPTTQMYVVFGYQFGQRAGPSDGYIPDAPISGRGF